MNQNIAKNNVLPFPQPEHLSDIINLTATELSKKYPKTYSSWKNMKSRMKKKICIVHSELLDFKDFLRLLGPCPTDLDATENYTLDRINPHDREYAVKKVRWATKQTQANNKTNTKTYTHNGITATLTQWAELTGRSRQALQNRLDKGLPYDKVFCHDIPKQSEVKVFKGWQQIPLPDKANIEELEHLYDPFFGTRAEWLLFHFVGHKSYLSPILAEAYNPYTQGFDKKKYQMLNHNLDKLEEHINRLKGYVRRGYERNSFNPTYCKNHREILNAYFGGNYF
jgi:hypothetical protein